MQVHHLVLRLVVVILHHYHLPHHKVLQVQEVQVLQNLPPQALVPQILLLFHLALLSLQVQVNLPLLANLLQTLFRLQIALHCPLLHRYHRVLLSLHQPV